jgi:hypothetical protein
MRGKRPRLSGSLFWDQESRFARYQWLDRVLGMLQAVMVEIAAIRGAMKGAGSSLISLVVRQAK